MRRDSEFHAVLAHILRSRTENPSLAYEPLCVDRIIIDNKSYITTGYMENLNFMNSGYSHIQSTGPCSQKLSLFVILRSLESRCFFFFFLPFV